MWTTGEVVDSQGLRQNGVRMSMDALRGCAGDNSHSKMRLQKQVLLNGNNSIIQQGEKKDI